MCPPAFLNRLQYQLSLRSDPVSTLAHECSVITMLMMMMMVIAILVMSHICLHIITFAIATIIQCLPNPQLLTYNLPNEDFAYQK